MKAQKAGRVEAATQWLFLSAVLVGGGLWTLYIRTRTGDWVSTPGRVIESKLVRRPLKPSYIEFSYTYEVDGYVYVGDRLLAGSDWALSTFLIWLDDAKSQHKSYPVGSSVQVYYDPKNPKRSALELSSINAPLVAIFAGVLLAVWVLS